MFSYNHNGEVYKVSRSMIDGKITIVLDNGTIEITCLIDSISNNLSNMSDIYNAISEKNIRLIDDSLFIHVNKSTNRYMYIYPIKTAISKKIVVNKVFSELEYVNIEPIEYTFENCFKTTSVKNNNDKCSFKCIEPIKIINMPKNKVYMV